MTNANSARISIVVSVYNEQEGLEGFWHSLHAEISRLSDKNLFEVIFVNDGSVDNSRNIINQILANSDGIKTKSVEFSRNFGHEAAMIAGIDQSDSDVIICMDSDLQHPPTKIADMLLEWENGSEIILMNRTNREDQKALSKLFSSIFYKTVSILSDQRFESNASDFFLISSDVANVLRTNFRERNRFLRGYIQIIGFNISTLEYEAPSRAAGQSNYNFRKLLSLAITAIFAFSDKPLRISLFASALFFVFSAFLIILSLYEYLVGNAVPSGYTTLIIAQSIGFTVLSFLISILSIYFGKSLSDIKDRPIYIIKSVKTSQK
jgi:dolichol-phosphate mannosyltransferase